VWRCCDLQPLIYQENEIPRLCSGDNFALVRHYMSFFRQLLCAFSLGLLGLSLPALAKETRTPAQTSQAITQAVEAAETAHDIQRAFPGEAGEQKIDRAPPTLEQQPQPQDTPDWLEKLFKFLKPLFKLVGWLLLAALAALIGYGAYQLVASYVNRPRKEGEAAAGGPLIDIDTSVAQSWLEDADALASTGRYGDAVHSLLLNAIDYLKRRAVKPIPRAWTAREIQQQLPISTLARALLQLLVQTVERAHFAGRDISAADYVRCRSSYEQLLGLKQLREAA
jgi:hypothetical protein